MTVQRAITTLALLVLPVSCGGSDCVSPPCLAPMAAIVTVTSAVTGAPLKGATVRATVAGGVATASLCGDGVWCVPGYGGHYVLDFSAAGYADVERVIDVTDNPPPGCGCTTVNTRQFTVALAPIS